jgi:cytochrome P450 / NADPH-cytochrome P450 reductase
MTSDRITFEPIPQPPGYPVLGNIFDLIGEETPIQALMKLARQYGPIFRLRMPQGSNIVLSGFELVDEVCDEKHFDKFLGAGLRNARAGTPKYLTTFPAQEGLRSYMYFA